MLVTLLSWIVEIYNGLFTSTSVLKTFTTYDELFSKIMKDSRFTNIVAVITTVGVSIMILYFLIDMADKASSKNINYEYYIKTFIKLALAYMLITNSMTIIQYMVSAGSALAKELSAAEGGNSFFADPAKVSMLKKRIKESWHHRLCRLPAQDPHFVSGSNGLKHFGHVYRYLKDRGALRQGNVCPGGSC